jgi:hypothetical protein
LVAQTSARLPDGQVCALFGSPKIKTTQAEACATKPCRPCHLSAGIEQVRRLNQYFVEMRVSCLPFGHQIVNFRKRGQISNSFVLIFLMQALFSGA